MPTDNEALSESNLNQLAANIHQTAESSMQAGERIEESDPATESSSDDLEKLQDKVIQRELDLLAERYGTKKFEQFLTDYVTKQTSESPVLEIPPTISATDRVASERQGLLLKQAHSGDQSAEAELLDLNEDVVRQEALSEFPNIGSERLEDVLQEGRLGLLGAIRNFRSEAPLTFLDQARIEIRRAVRSSATQLVQTDIPLEALDRIGTLPELELVINDPDLVESGTWKKDLNLEVIKQELSEIKILQAMANPFALDDPDNQNKLWYEGLEEAFIHPGTREELIMLIETVLSPVHQAIIISRFGLDEEALTLKQAGELFHLSSERIRQIEARAIYRLRSRWIKSVREYDAIV